MCAAVTNPASVLKLHRGQKIVLKDNHRFRVIVAGRRWGKTQVSKVAAVIAACSKPNQLVWYVSPTYGMSRQNFWEPIKAALPREWIVKNGINEQRMEIRLINGSKIVLKGADNPDSLRGVGIHFLIIDEAQDVKAETWEMVLRPTLSSTGGKVLFIGTPKSFNWLYDKFIEGQKGAAYIDPVTRKLVFNDWKSWQFPTSTSPFIPKKEIEMARRDMDPKSFRQEYEASFETMSGRVYYPFDRRTHVGDYAFNPKLPIKIGMDFNIDPMSMVVCQEQENGEIWVVDEIILPGSNTQESADEMVRRYFRHMGAITIYPDPAGNNRSNGRGETSLDILREAGFKRIKFRRKHPAVQDRVNAVNRLLMTADGTIRMRVDRKCKTSTNSPEQTIYKPGTKEVDKSAGLEHAADAFGYFAELEHPVRELQLIGISI